MLDTTVPSMWHNAITMVQEIAIFPKWHILKYLGVKGYVCNLLSDGSEKISYYLDTSEKTKNGKNYPYWI